MIWKQVQKNMLVNFRTDFYKMLVDLSRQTKAGFILWADPQITKIGGLLPTSYHEKTGWCKYLFYNYKLLSSGLEVHDCLGYVGGL